jgi:hypothetical protein
MYLSDPIQYKQGGQALLIPIFGINGSESLIGKDQLFDKL